MVDEKREVLCFFRTDLVGARQRAQPLVCVGFVGPEKAHIRCLLDGLVHDVCSQQAFPANSFMPQSPLADHTAFDPDANSGDRGAPWSRSRRRLTAVHH